MYFLTVGCFQRSAAHSFTDTDFTQYPLRICYCTHMSTNPTPYPDVNAVLHRLLAEVQAVLGERFVGLYLYGSLAGGDFDPDTS